MNKNTILNSGIYSEFLKYRRMLFLKGIEYNNKNNYLDLFDEELVIQCFRIYEANKRRKTYGLNEILKWLFCIKEIPVFKDHKLVLGTLTFTDTTLEKTSKETRRRYVTRYLKKYCIKYLGNIDFGKENGREHYHFIAMIKDNIPKNSWSYGCEDLRTINTTIKDIKKVRSYLLKLNNHSYKESTRNERVLMDKNKDKTDMIDFVIDRHQRSFKRFKLLFVDNENLDFENVLIQEDDNQDLCQILHK